MALHWASSTLVVYISSKYIFKQLFACNCTCTCCIVWLIASRNPVEVIISCSARFILALEKDSHCSGLMILNKIEQKRLPQLISITCFSRLKYSSPGDFRAKSSKLAAHLYMQLTVHANNVIFTTYMHVYINQPTKKGDCIDLLTPSLYVWGQNGGQWLRRCC